MAAVEEVWADLYIIEKGKGKRQFYCMLIVVLIFYGDVDDRKPKIQIYFLFSIHKLHFIPCSQSFHIATNNTFLIGVARHLYALVNQRFILYLYQNLTVILFVAGQRDS